MGYQRSGRRSHHPWAPPDLFPRPVLSGLARELLSEGDRVKRWNVYRFAFAGGLLGLLLAAFDEFEYWVHPTDVTPLGPMGIMSCALGGAALGALVSSIRNVLVRWL